MRTRDVAQAFHRHDARDRLADQGKHLARAGVEEQRLLIKDQVLVERESTPPALDTPRGIDPVDPASPSWTLVPDCVLVTTMLVLLAIPVISDPIPHRQDLPDTSRGDVPLF